MNAVQFCFWFKGIIDGSKGAITEHEYHMIVSNINTTISSQNDSANNFVKDLKGLLKYANTFETFAPFVDQILNQFSKIEKDIYKESPVYVRNLPHIDVPPFNVPVRPYTAPYTNPLPYDNNKPFDPSKITC